MDCSLPASSVHGNSLGKNTRVGYHFLLQEIFPTQEWKPGLLHCRQINNWAMGEASVVAPGGFLVEIFILLL